ncbi:MAG: PH domain-containing protein [Clostridia bacterium]|nr:PH domain-containing protein [Clostridia bacterium]
MILKQLDRLVLKLWYIRAAMWSVLWIAVAALTVLILAASGATATVCTAVGLCVGLPVLFALLLTWLLPYFRYRLFSWGYDEKTMVVRQGVIFRKRVVIPICQIQDLHRCEGPIMTLLKLSDVTISTAGSNFTLSTLPTTEADTLIDALEKFLETRIEELRHEEI